MKVIDKIYIIVYFSITIGLGTVLFSHQDSLVRKTNMIPIVAVFSVFAACSIGLTMDLGVQYLTKQDTKKEPKNES